MRIFLSIWVSKMKIAMTVSNNVINDVRVIKEANALIKLGHQVTIFGVDETNNKFNIYNIKVINSKSTLVKKLIQQIKKNKKIYDNSSENKNLNKVKYSSNQKFKLILLKDLIKYFGIRAIIKGSCKRIYKSIVKSNIKFDAIHCHDLDTLEVGIKLKKHTNCKLIYDSHELWTEMSGINKYIKKEYSNKEMKYMNTIDCLITVSPSIIAEIKKRYHYTGNTLLLRNIPEYDAVNTELQTSDDKIKLLYIGYYLNGRGIEFLLDCAKDFPANTYLTLIIQNDNAIFNKLKNIIKDSNIEDKIEIKAFVPQSELINEISKYDIGILPYLPISLNNLFCLPNKLFQYMYGGVCIVSNKLPDVKYVLNKYLCGETYESKEDFINIIEKLSFNKELLMKYKINSLNAIKNELTWKNEVNQLIKIYGEVDEEREEQHN